MKALATVYAVVGFVVAPCATSFAAEPIGTQAETPCEFCGFWKTVGADGRDIFTEPVRWQASDWRSVAWKSALVAGSIALLDEPTRDYLQRHRSDGSQRIADVFEPFGATYALGTLAGFAVVGFAGDRATARAVAVDGTVSTVIASGIITPLLKALTGRSRPHDGQGAHDFNGWGGGESFPSGHTTEAFAVAASIAENYHRPWISGLSYSIAGLVGYARMEHDDHWLSDVAAGAFIGVGVGKQVAKLHRNRRNIAFMPLEAPGVRGIRVSVSF